MIHLPTYEEALNIVNENGELIFYENKHIIEGYNVSVFNYRLAQYEHFIKPLKNSNIDARELRGLTFVFNADGTLFKRYLMLRKFWNVNQVPETQFDKIRDYEQKNVYNKEDGSLISFIQLPNSNIIPKTKMGFDNEQCIESKKLFDSDDKLKNFIKTCFEYDYITMWEFTSFKNRIVLDYRNPALYLLRVRDNNNGNFIDIKPYTEAFLTPKEENVTINDTIKLKKTVENKEGWVHTLIDPQGNDFMVKVKTDWYMSRHNLLTNDIGRENVIIRLIIDGEIDDVKADINDFTDSINIKIQFIENIEKVVQEFLSETLLELSFIMKDFKDFKSFANKYKKHEFFSIMTKVLRGEDLYETLSEYLKYNTRRLEMARFFIKNKKLC